ncbi:MAG TPA: hypothetical protein VHK01_00550, partial [Lacipirellulaceae bacterium]|nr:hypothetical protein [Lacipirellulaceae bacterium]
MPRRSQTFVCLASAAMLAANAMFLASPGMAVEGREGERSTYLRYAMEHDGDAEKGAQLFQSHAKLLCADCHNVTGLEKSGPNL